MSLFSQQFRSLVGHQFTFPAPLEHETRRGRRKSDRGEEEEERRGRRRSMRGEEEQPRSISRLGSLPLAGSNSALSSVLHIHVSLTSDISLFPFSVIIITTSLRCPILFLFLSLRHQKWDYNFGNFGKLSPTPIFSRTQIWAVTTSMKRSSWKSTRLPRKGDAPGSPGWIQKNKIECEFLLDVTQNLYFWNYLFLTYLDQNLWILLDMCVLNPHVMFLRSQRASNGSPAVKVTNDSLLTNSLNGRELSDRMSLWKFLW